MFSGRHEQEVRILIGQGVMEVKIIYLGHTDITVHCAAEMYRVAVTRPL